MKILYVEDDPSDADLARRELARSASSITLEVATTLQEARARLAEKHGYDLVLADLHLPDGSGLDLLAEIREQALPLAVVILTNAGDENIVIAALKAGADDYLPKRDGYLGRLPFTLESALARFKNETDRRSRRLRVLYAEHNSADLDLTRRHLARYASHIVLDIVHTPPEVLHKLTTPAGSEPPPYDVVLMDYRLPGMNALETLKVLRQECSLDLPVVLVTGQGDEETAAQALRLGASDYLSKRPGYLFELPTALENAYHRAELAREHAALQASEARFRLLAENARDVIFRYRVWPTMSFEYISPAVTRMLGYTPQDFYADPELTFNLIHPEDRMVVGAALIDGRIAEPMIIRWNCKDGHTIWVEVITSSILDADGKLIAVEGIARDITERKSLEHAEHEEHMLAEALLDITAAINSTLDLSEVLKRILSNVGTVIPHDGANIMLLDGTKETIRVVGFCDCYAGNGLAQPEIGDIYATASRPHVRKMVEDGQPLTIPDVRSFPGWTPGPNTGWIRSYAGAPISLSGQAIGLINLDSGTLGAFSEHDAARLQAFADQAAVAIGNAQMYRELQAHSEDLEVAVKERTSQLLQIKERVEAILNNNPDAILLLGADSMIDAGNPAFSTWFGYERDEIYHHPLVDLVAPESTAELGRMLAAVVADRKTSRIEVMALRKDGTTFDVMMALAPVEEDEQLLSVVCSLQDISQLKLVERMKDAFVSNVSHELRTPITSIKLNQKLIRINPDRQPAYLDRMERETNRLNDLIEDLLRLSRLDQGHTELDLAPVNLNDMVDEHVGDRSTIAESRSLSISAHKQPDLPLVEADGGLLGQALSVLLTNALNYTPAGGAITVSTAAQQQAGQTWVGFSVSDTGPGIPPEERPYVFDRFYRGRAGHSSGMPGTGLGLAIAQEIVSRHDGRIEVGSGDPSGAGAVFSVWLPLKDDAH